MISFLRYSVYLPYLEVYHTLWDVSIEHSLMTRQKSVSHKLVSALMGRVKSFTILFKRFAAFGGSKFQQHPSALSKGGGLPPLVRSNGPPGPFWRLLEALSAGGGLPALGRGSGPPGYSGLVLLCRLAQIRISAFL